jgi:hypothetical protein
MVIVTDVIEKINSQSEKPFVLLEISGGLEMVQSQGTGKFYATMRKCRVPSTFNLDVAKMLIGTTIPGTVVRVEVEGYEYTVPSTGEVIKLAHSYAYQPEGSMELMGQTNVELIEDEKPATSRRGRILPV